MFSSCLLLLWTNKTHGQESLSKAPEERRFLSSLLLRFKRKKEEGVLEQKAFYCPRYTDVTRTSAATEQSIQMGLVFVKLCGDWSDVLEDLLEDQRRHWSTYYNSALMSCLMQFSAYGDETQTSLGNFQHPNCRSMRMDWWWFGLRDHGVLSDHCWVNTEEGVH